MMKHSKLAVVVLFALASRSATAQVHRPNQSPGTSGSLEDVIKDAPFSSDSITASDTIMPNGEHKRTVIHGRLCRDSQGRIYEDLGFRSSGESGTMPPVQILDPVAHTHISLDPVRKEAAISDWPRHPLKLKSNGIPPHPDARQPRQPRTLKVEDLGTQLIEGLTVKGTRTTKTWSPEGKAVDPDNLTVMTNWFSEQLQITILSEFNEGKRSGSQHKDVNIVRAEPDQSQFKIPPGYKVFDSRERLDGTRDREKGTTERR